MTFDEIRAAVLCEIASIAPEADLRTIRPDQPLRKQIDLDSMDWLNLVAGLQERLPLASLDPGPGPLATLDGIVEWLAARPTAPTAGSRRPDAARPSRHLVDGTEVTLRPMHADDAPLEADFVRHLSDDSRYKRFMGTVRELPEAKLRALTDVDGIRHVALLATAQRDGREVELGVARYVVDPPGTGCEFAVAIDDAWQGTGLAGILMHALIDTARSRGLVVMEGSVLASNLRMLKFARQLGFEVQHDPDDAKTRRVVREL